MENKADSQRSDWRKLSTGLLYNLKHILINGIMTDLTIRLINGEDIMEYKVHKFVFQLASEVFDRMINLPFKEGLSNIIEIKDVKPDTFQLFLNHLYGQPLIITNLEQAHDLFQLADYYLIDSLKVEIVDFCQTTDTPEFACVGLEVAEKYEAPMLREAKLQYISKNTKEVVESTNFLKLSLEAMTAILEHDKISIREIDLFKAVRVWIEQNLSAKGASIKEFLIPKLRYSSMSLSEFIEGPVASKLVESDDLAPLMSHLFTRNSSVPLPVGFSEAKRIYSNQLTTESLPLLEQSGARFYIKVTANKSIQLTHFLIYPALITDEEEYQENVTIYSHNSFPDNNKKQIANFSGTVNVVDRIEIKLDQKLQLNKNQSYQLYISCSSSSYKRNVVHLTGTTITCENISLKFEKYFQYNNYYDSIGPLHSLLFEC